MRRRLFAFGLILTGAAFGQAAGTDPAVWQWSVPIGNSHAYLWIPENCKRVRAVLFAQHNMIERGILEHPVMRQTLAKFGIAEVFVFPSKDPVFDFEEGAGDWFEQAMDTLAAVSGYDELADVPVAPIGHSAHASFPWNFAAWNPERTLAALSVKGDAPQTALTGSGRPNPDWGNRSLAGLPGLMVMGEYEWWEKRLKPLLEFKEANPKVPLAMFADVGQGHFDATDELVQFLAMFLSKAADARLPTDESGELRPVDPTAGWLVDRWRNDEPPRADTAPFDQYDGKRADTFWCFDEQMARAIESAYAKGRGKAEQQVGFFQNGKPMPISNTHAGTELRFLPEDDGLTFHPDAGFIAPLPPDPPSATKDERPPVVTTIPEPAAEGTHASGEVTVFTIVGPVDELGGGRFRVAPDWMFPAGGEQPLEAWFLALSPGDENYKSAARQALLRIPRIREGASQTITFPKISDQEAERRTVSLGATSDSGLPVAYYVSEGPAFVRGNTLHLTPLPQRAKRPVRVTVVAWQFGRGTDPKVRAAAPVTQTFRVK